VQLREGVLAGRRKNNQELLDGEGVEGIRPDWLEKRKKMQIDWRRGWSHGIGEQARWIGAAATSRRLRIRGAAGHPPSPFPSISKSATSPHITTGGVRASAPLLPIPARETLPRGPVAPFSQRAPLLLIPARATLPAQPRSPTFHPCALAILSVRRSPCGKIDAIAA